LSGVSNHRDEIARSLYHMPLLPFSLPAGVPRAISEYLLFPYVRGMDFVMVARQRGGWAAIDALYDDPPVSTEQVIHPEKYFGEEDVPTIVSISDLSDAFGADWRPGAVNVLGELFVQVWLSEWLAPRDFAGAPAGWDGDQLRAFEKGSDGPVAVVWYSVWDTDQDAREMFVAVGELIRSRFHDSVPVTTAADLLVVEADTVLHYAEVRGLAVAVIINCPADSLEPVVKRLWSTTATAPFDLSAVKMRKLEKLDECE